MSQRADTIVTLELLRYKRPVRTVFDLLGRKEDDMTYALGYVVSRSHAFARSLVKALDGTPGDPEQGVARLQSADHKGRTDVELEWRGGFHAIFEAKRGPFLPEESQLRRYAERLTKSDAGEKRLVVVTNTTQAYARMALPEAICGIDVRHLTWRRVRELARHARPGENNRNKHLLDDFDAYLTEILGMENNRSNMVYVVSLGAGGEWGLSFREVVTKHRRYFFPTQGRWPAAPPNYIAFRYDGMLQSIHHVEGYEVFTNPRDVFDEAQSHKIPPHYLLRLGPAIHPPREVRNGPKIKQAMRVWCMIDLLLTCATITQARDQTKKRLGKDAAEISDDSD